MFIQGFEHEQFFLSLSLFSLLLYFVKFEKKFIVVSIRVHRKGTIRRRWNQTANNQQYAVLILLSVVFGSIRPNSIVQQALYNIRFLESPVYHLDAIFCCINTISDVLLTFIQVYNEILFLLLLSNDRINSVPFHFIVYRVAGVHSLNGTKRLT